MLKKANEELTEKLTDVLENRSERNRWIAHFTKYSTMQEIDRKIVMQLIKSIRVLGKEDLDFSFTYQDEYKKALALVMQMADSQTAERKAG